MIETGQNIKNNKSAMAFVPRGDSMWPFLKDKQQTVIIEKNTERLKVYDVALYVRENGERILHRVIEVLKDGYVVCGDSQNTPETVKEEQIIGVMAGYYSGKKYVDVKNVCYRKKVKKFYSNCRQRNIRLKFFFFKKRVKNKLKRLFKVKDKNV